MAHAGRSVKRPGAGVTSREWRASSVATESTWPPLGSGSRGGGGGSGGGGSTSSATPSSSPTTAKTYKVGPIPDIVVLDASGKVVARNLGYLKAPEMVTFLSEALAKAPQ